MSKKPQYDPAEIRFPDQHIVESPLVPEMEKSYIEYAMSVIVGRALPDVREGDEATLWGGTVSDSAETIARKTDTISYEVLCGVSRRVPRVYLENGGVKAVEDWIL